MAALTAWACSEKKPVDDPAVAAVCRTRDETQSAVNGSEDKPLDQYPKVIAGLEAAVKVAPPDIRPDFVEVHDVLKPFVDALTAAGGDADVAAQDPNYQAKLAAVGSASAQAAGKRVHAYYASHC